MTTAAPVKSPSRAIANAANSGMAAPPPGGCQDCVKKGLAILPVVGGVLPNEVRPQLPGLDRWLDSTDLKEHWYFMRSLPAGYLYVLKSDKAGNAPALGGWDAYVVDADGLLRKVAPGTQPASAVDVAPMAATCKRKGDNIPAQVIAVDPVAHPKIWMAFSRYRWSTDVLSSYAKDHAGCRTARMTAVDVTAAAAGQLGGTSVVKNGINMGPQLAQAVADYAPSAQRQLVNRNTSEPVQARAEQVAALTSAMAKISELTPAKSGAVILIDDAAGVAAELNLRRNRLAADAAAVAGMGDADRSRRRVVAEVIEGIRASAENNPGPWWNRNYGPERYLKHIKQDEWRQALAESAEFKILLKKIDAYSDDFVAVKEGSGWKAQQRSDFDPLDSTSWRDHGNMVAASVAGSGMTKAERERVWMPVLKATVAAEDNWLDRALVALHPDAQKYLREDKKQDKAYDFVKSAATISRELTSDGLKQLSKLYASLRIARAGNEAMSALVQSAAAMLYRLRQSDPEAHYKLMRKVAVALLVRDGQVAQPKVVRGPLEKIAQWIQEVATGPARVASAPLKVRADISDYKAYQGVKGNFGEDGWRLSQALDGAVVFDSPKTQGKNGEVVAWVITRLQEGASLDERLVARLGLQNIDLTSPRPGTVNPFLEGALTRAGSRADAVLSAGVIFFQINAFMNGLEEYQTKAGALDKAGGGLGMLTAVLSASSAGLEGAVAVQVLRGVDKTKLVGIQVWAARLSLWAGAIEGAFLVTKGIYKSAWQKDMDSGLWTLGSGLAVAAAGIASYGAGMAVAAGLASGGALAGSATVLGMSAGPIGWAILALVFIGAAIYFSIQAFGTDDENLTPVEYWLDNGVFGKRQHLTGDVAAKSPFYSHVEKRVLPFADANEELRQLQTVTLVVNASINGARDRGGYSVLSFYKVALPKYEVGTRLEVKFIAIKGTQRRDGGGFVCEDGKPTVVSNTISPKFTGMREGPTIKLDAQTGLMLVEGWFATLQEEPTTEKLIEWIVGKDTNPDALYAERIEMQVRYEPNRNTMPGVASKAEDIN